MNQYCRICSRSDEAHKFSLSTVSQICQETIEDMLIYCTQLEVVPFDGLPQIICAECFNALNAAFFFRKLCYKSDSVLKELRRNASIDLQPRDQPPETELIALPEKQTEASSVLILKEENYESEDIIEPITEAIIDPCPLEEQEPNRSFPVSEYNQKRRVYTCKECFFKSHDLASFNKHQSTFKHTLNFLKFQSIFSCPYCGVICNDYSHIKKCNKNPNLREAIGFETEISENAENLNSMQAIKHEANIREITDEEVMLNQTISEENHPETEVNPTPTKRAKVDPALDVSKIVESNRDKNYWTIRCDFCSYNCLKEKSNNLRRHLATKCKGWHYKNEGENIFSNNFLRSVRNTVNEIAAFTSLSGKKLFTNHYVPELYSSTSASVPPLELISCVQEYAWWLVITMRGYRCCGCSLFFIDIDSLLAHRDVDHPSGRPIISKLFRQCSQCNRILPNKESLIYHQQLEKSNKLMYCITCAQIVVSNTAWVSHCGMFHSNLTVETNSYIRMEHSHIVRNQSVRELQKELDPIEIDNESRNSSELNETKLMPLERIPKPPVQHRCPRCTFKCGHLSSLRTHIVRHTILDCFICRICNVSYKTKLELQHHKKNTHDFKQLDEELHSGSIE